MTKWKILLCSGTWKIMYPIYYTSAFACVWDWGIELFGKTSVAVVLKKDLTLFLYDYCMIYKYRWLNSLRTTLIIDRKNVISDCFYEIIRYRHIVHCCKGEIIYNWISLTCVCVVIM